MCDGKHNVSSDSSYNVTGVMTLYIKRAMKAQMQVGLILLWKVGTSSGRACRLLHVRLKQRLADFCGGSKGNILSSERYIVYLLQLFDFLVKAQKQL